MGGTLEAQSGCEVVVVEIMEVGALFHTVPCDVISAFNAKSSPDDPPPLGAIINSLEWRVYWMRGGAWLGGITIDARAEGRDTKFG